MHNHYELDFPCAIVREDVDISTYPEFNQYHWAVWNDRSDRYLTPEAVAFIHSMGICDQVWFDNKLQPDHVAVFRGNKDTFMDIHCDRGPSWCINYVWGSSRSEMSWWEPDSDINLSPEMCSIGSEYMKYDPLKCNLIDSVELTGPTLVRIDIPHNVVNYDKENYRWCLSIRDLSNKWTWEEAVEKFRPWFAHDAE